MLCQSEFSEAVKAKQHISFVEAGKLAKRRKKEVRKAEMSLLESPRCRMSIKRLTSPLTSRIIASRRGSQPAAAATEVSTRRGSFSRRWSSARGGGTGRASGSGGGVAVVSVVWGEGIHHAVIGLLRCYFVRSPIDSVHFLLDAVFGFLHMSKIRDLCSVCSEWDM